MVLNERVLALQLWGECGACAYGPVLVAVGQELGLGGSAQYFQLFWSHRTQDVTPSDLKKKKKSRSGVRYKK